MNTPTPRTDVAANARAARDLRDVPSDFARQLERELDAALTERNAARVLLEATQKGLAELTTRFTKIESLYFDLAIKTGTTVAPECEAGEVTRAREALSTDKPLDLLSVRMVVHSKGYSVIEDGRAGCYNVYDNPNGHRKDSARAFCVSLREVSDLLATLPTV